MHEIQPNRLWLGNASDIRRARELFDAGIGAVVDVACEEPPAQLPRQLIYCRFPLNDGGGNDPSVLLHAVQTVVGFLAAGTRTIVGCSAGMSRSPTIVAFALAAHLRAEPDEMLKRIAVVKSLEINGELWSDLTDILPRVLVAK